MITRDVTVAVSSSCGYAVSEYCEILWEVTATESKVVKQSLSIGFTSKKLDPNGRRQETALRRCSTLYLYNTVPGALEECPAKSVVGF